MDTGGHRPACAKPADRWAKGAVAAALVLFAACARQAPPPGGPPDRTPPGVVWTVPAADSAGVGPKTSIRIGFSEAMDRRSVERAVFISPRFSREPDFRWHGQELEVRPSEDLRPDRTYLITVGAESADEARNRMVESYSFAFATGLTLNRGEIVGRVFSPLEGPSGQTYVWAYELPEGEGPDPASDPPAYVTQPGAGGDYRFPRLGPGRYRIFAFEDRNGNQAYTPGTDPLAVPPAELPLLKDADRVRLGSLKMALRDTIPPRFLSGRTPDGRHFLLRFDEPVSPPAKMHVKGPEGLLKVLALTCDPGDSSRVWLLTAPQKAGADYRIDLGGIRDRAGNRIPAGVEVQVKGDGAPDRRAPTSVSHFPALEARYISPDAPLLIDFSEAMAAVVPVDFWVFSDSTVAPAGHFSWTAPNRLRFTSATPWSPGETYRLLGRLEGLADPSGNALETPLAFKFTVSALEDLGDLSGAVVPADATVVIEARRLSPPERAYEAEVAPGDSLYALIGLIPGRYQVTGFLDRDGDGHWSPGEPRPFMPAEPLTDLPDTLEVRPRWDMESERRLRTEAWYPLSEPPPED